MTDIYIDRCWICGEGFIEIGVDSIGRFIAVCDECLSAYKDPADYFFGKNGYKEYVYTACKNTEMLPDLWSEYIISKEEFLRASESELITRREAIRTRLSE